MADWYDHPQYFDMLFRDETAREVEFLEEAFIRYGKGKTRRLLEPGCGSGRLVAAMVARGYQVTGIDLSQPMLDYTRRRVEKRGLSAQMVRADMTDFRLKRKFDAAFCTFNTFRHLLTDHQAITHLNTVADHLRKGGLYVLGLHLIPLDADEECTERWRASHGGTTVNGTLRVIDFDRKSRLETLRMSIKATKRSGKVERIKSEFQLRIYTPDQGRKLLAKVKDRFEIAGIHDFDYEIDETRDFDDDLTDAVFVLRRK